MIADVRFKKFFSFWFTVKECCSRDEYYWLITWQGPFVSRACNMMRYKKKIMNLLTKYIKIRTIITKKQEIIKTNYSLLITLINDWSNLVCCCGRNGHCVNWMTGSEKDFVRMLLMIVQCIWRCFQIFNILRCWYTTFTEKQQQKHKDNR